MKKQFDIQKALPAAWDRVWAEKLERRAADEKLMRKLGKDTVYGYSDTFGVSATELERWVRGFAQDEHEGKPWGSNDGLYSYVRIYTNSHKSLLRICRDWLLRGNGGKIVGHNFGKGHISGMKFRPRGEPLSPAEKVTIKKHAEPYRERPRHFAESGHKLLCQKQARVMWGSRSHARSTTKVTEVTCSRCKKLLTDRRAMLAAQFETEGKGATP